MFDSRAIKAKKPIYFKTQYFKAKFGIKRSRIQLQFWMITKVTEITLYNSAKSVNRKLVLLVLLNEVCDFTICGGISFFDCHLSCSQNQA